MNEMITSLQNPQVKAWRSLNKSRAERVKQGLFLAEGEHMAGEALQANRAQALLIAGGAWEKYAALAAQAEAQGVLTYVLADHVLSSLCDAKTPQGVAAVCPWPQDNPLTGGLLVALNGVQDPGNVGTIIRTMDAAGYQGLLLDDATADPLGPKALRASMGGVFRVPCRRCDDLPAALRRLAAQGYEIIAGDLRGHDFYHRPPVREKLCVIIGNEGAGVSPDVMACATMRLKIPILGGAESLNAAVAGAIMMYDLIRERL